MEQIIVVTDASDDGLPIASTTDPGKILNSDDYSVFENVPVFVEHQRALKNGRTLQFGKNELQMVADRSNRRIAETGDFAPVVIGHTSSETGAVKPPKIGWAGPFRLGWLTPTKDKYAILADFRIEKDKVGLLKEYPRRSAEIWAEENYEDMYLDPISLLGADTPWSDMGVLYAKEGSGTEKVYYSIAPQAPSAYSGLPSAVKVGKTSKKEKYSMDANGLSNEQQEIAQTIVTAILNTPEFKFLRQQMSGKNKEEMNGLSSLENQSAGAPPKAEPIGQAQPLENIEEEENSPKKPTKYEAGGESEGDEGNMSAVEGESPMQYGAKKDPLAPKQPLDDLEEEEDDDEDLDDDDDISLDDEEDLDDDDDISLDDEEDLDDDDDISLDDEEDLSLDDDDLGEEDFGEDDIGLDDEEDILSRNPGGARGLSYIDEPFSDEEDNQEDTSRLAGLGNNGRTNPMVMNNVQALRREIAGLRNTIKQQQESIRKLQIAFDWTTNKVVSKERYEKLADLRSRYIFDEKAEREKCRYNKMKTAEFERRCQEIATTHRPVPTKIGVPAGLVQNAPADFAERPGAIQYAKECGANIEDEVMRLSDMYASKGISKSSEELREEARKNCGKNCR